MDILSLAGFVAAAGDARRIRFGDVRRLARDILPGGIASRVEAELLLALDRMVSRPDPAWAEFLVGALRAYLTGHPAADGDVWLAAALGPKPTKTGLAILAALRVPAPQPSEPSHPVGEAGLAERELDPARTPSIAQGLATATVVA